MIKFQFLIFKKKTKKISCLEKFISLFGIKNSNSSDKEQSPLQQWKKLLFKKKCLCSMDELRMRGCWGRREGAQRAIRHLQQLFSDATLMKRNDRKHFCHLILCHFLLILKKWQKKNNVPFASLLATQLYYFGWISHISRLFISVLSKSEYIWWK